MSNTKLQPLSGFPELLPEEQIVYQRILDTIRREYERCGFCQIETPAVERQQTLLSKGGDEKEIYAMTRLAAASDESAGTDLALHFDLTIPLARYVAMHHGDLSFPFRRYQMQKVWRGERAQSGRYREFYQCDIDVIGREKLDMITDAEIPSIIYNIFRKLALGSFLIRINNRRLLNGYFEYCGVAEESRMEVMRIIDKLDKVGDDQVVKELRDSTELTEEIARNMLAFLGKELRTDDMLAFLKEQKDMGEIFDRGRDELESVIKGIRHFGVPDEFFCIDLSIARGLDYYTGTVYETTLSDYPELGSVCSGGRYDDLAMQFCDEKFPGVGISIGVTRLVVPLLRSGSLPTGASTPAAVLITSMDAAFMDRYIQIATQLRAADINTEIYLASKKIGDQLKYAHKKGFSIVLIAGEDEMAKGVVQIKEMSSGDAVDKTVEEMIPFITQLLQS